MQFKLLYAGDICKINVFSLIYILHNDYKTLTYVDNVLDNLEMKMAYTL